MGFKTKIKNYFNKIEKTKFLEKLYFQTSSVKNILKVLVFEVFDHPIVTIIIYTKNNKSNFLNCLNNLNNNLTNAYPFKIILINPDDDIFYLNEIHGIKIINSKNNIVQTINQEIKQASTQYVYLLNCELLVQKNALKELFLTFDNFKNIGVSCSLIKNIEQKKIDAGNYIINNKKSSVNGDYKSHSPDLRFIQKIDVCTESFLIKKSNINLLNVFDEDFSLINFCLNLKHVQKKEIYLNPFSEVFTKINLNSNQNNLTDLKLNIESTTNQARIQELYCYKSIVIFCGMFPEHDKDSGSNRLREIIFAFHELDFLVTVISKNIYYDHPYIQEYLKKGINVYYEFDKNIDVKTYLKNKKLNANLSWFYSPNTFSEYYKIAQQYLPNSKLIYDMVDIHHLRFERAIELEPTRISLRKKYKKYKKLEIESAKKCDILITISEFEENYMSDFCEKEKITTISNIHYTKIEKIKTFPFNLREDLLFIGSMHTPNIDALYYLLNEIMPIVWQKIPEINVNIIGNINNVVRDIIHPNFKFLGFVPNIDELFSSNKMMVAPLRYGAGVKGKVGQAFEYYLPVVTSSIGAEGMKLINRENACIEDSAQGFAKAILEVYSNEVLWSKLQNNSEKSLKPFSRENLLYILNKL